MGAGSPLFCAMKLMGREIDFRFWKRRTADGGRRTGDGARTRSATGGYMTAGYWESIYGDATSKAGATVNNETLLSVAPMFAAIRVVSTALAGLMAAVYRVDGTNKVLDAKHPVGRFLRGRPSPTYTRFDFFAALVANAMMGNGFARIYRDESTMRPVELEIVPSEFVTIEMDAAGGIWYRVVGQIGAKTLNYVAADTEMLHLKGLTMNGIDGKQIRLVHKGTMGAAIASQEFTEQFFGNGAHPSAVVTSRDSLTPAERVKLEGKVGDKIAGLKNAGGVVVLDGMEDYRPIQANMNDAALIDFRHLTVDDVSRITGVPPHLLANLDRSTNNNIAHQGEEFVRYCLAGWAKKIEEEILSKLFFEEEQFDFEYKFSFTSLLMADSQSESDFCRTAIQNGFMTGNEARMRFGFNPLPGGDQLLIQLNMVPLDKLGEAQELENENREPSSKTETETKPTASNE